MVYNFFDKKTCGGTVKNGTIYNKKLAEELHKPIITKFRKRKKTTFNKIAVALVAHGCLFNCLVFV